MPSFYIAPNSTIILLRDIPIDEGQEHTLWFANAEAQATYFLGKAAATFNQQYYTRQNRGVIKVETTADNVYDCNYMMYKNTSFGNKWFYAFITSIEYTNNNTATITFKIDQLQTWLFNFSPAECFVEREHSATDVIGENLVPENLETGEYVYTNMARITNFNDLFIVLAVTEVWDATQNKFVPASGYGLQNMYQGVSYIAYQYTAQGITEVNTILDRYTEKNKSDAVVAVFMCPSVIYNSYADGTPTSFAYVDRPNNLNGYTPHNNKLFTAPYISILVKTPGNAAEYGWEYFSRLYSQQPIFALYCNLSTSPSAMLCPTNYKTTVGGADTVSINYVEGITLNGFPQCSYNIDTFKAWIAQNGPTIYVNSALAGAGLGASLAGGLIPAYSGRHLASPDRIGINPDGGFSGSGIVGSLGAIANIVAQTIQHSTLPPQARGDTNGNIAVASKTMEFLFFTKTLNYEFAQIIDQFFDKFGYATHKVKVPNIHVRQYWTYTKTVDCIIHGNLPTEAITEIQNIFNRGVTFWADPTKVGHYYLQNSPITEGG